MRCVKAVVACTPLYRAPSVGQTLHLPSERKAALLDQGRTLQKAVRKIDPQHRDRRSANGGAADEHGAVPAKVPRPLVPARMKQPGPLPRLGIDPGQVRPLVVVIRETCQG